MELEEYICPQYQKWRLTSFPWLLVVLHTLEIAPKLFFLASWCIAYSWLLAVTEIQDGKSINWINEQHWEKGRVGTAAHRLQTTACQGQKAACQCSSDHHKSTNEKSQQNKSNKVLISLASLTSHKRHTVANTSATGHNKVPESSYI